MEATKNKQVKDAVGNYIEENEEVNGQAARFALQSHVESLDVDGGDELDAYLDSSPSLEDGLEWCAAAVVEGATTVDAVKTALTEYETGGSQSSGPTIHDRLDEIDTQLDRIEQKVRQS